MQNTLNMFTRGTVIKERYEIQFPISKNSLVESYRVKHKDSGFLQLDLINLASIPFSFFDDQGKLIQIELMKNISNSNIASLIDEGEIIINKQKYAYLSFDFISGESLLDKLSREGTLSPYGAIPIVIELLEALEYLHNLPEPIVHNSISPNTVFLDLSEKREKPILIHFEQARTIHNSSQSVSFKYLSHFHCAPELLNGIFIPQSDIFSTGALLYQLLFGLPPWYNESIADQPINKIKGLIEGTRAKPLDFHNADRDEIDDHLINTLSKALAIDIEDRFKTAAEFSKALKREMTVNKPENKKPESITNEKRELRKGSGFDKIAGMTTLKEILFTDVIRALSEKELYAKYGITIPNGMLLYGPPGCGKTFIAQQFAEEVGYNFIMIKPSDLQSKYINATQENIAKMFKDAEAKQPTIIFIDELDALVPSRENDLHQMHAGAVNELLAQMTNCGERGIFIIGATNRPEKIDAAILRSGRLDKAVYLPPPDFLAREAMFQMYLKNRPIDLEVEYSKLALLTEYYVSSDIKFLVDEASRNALKYNKRITMDILEEVIKQNPPSVTLKEINKYIILKQEWENEKRNIKEQSDDAVIGFRLPNSK